LVQFLIGPDLIFPFDTLLPSNILVEGYRTIAPLAYGSPLRKSNGLFFLEPSHFSQCIALAVIIEIRYFRRWRFLLAYIAGLVVAFSGTGLVLLGLFLSFTMFRMNVRLLLGIVSGSIVGATAVLLSPWGSYFTDRISEFQDPGASGFARFISPFHLIYDYMLSNPQKLLLGLGPGSLTQYLEKPWYLAHDPTWIKVYFEYGLIGGTMFLVFVLHCLLRRSLDAYIASAMLFQFLILGGYVMTPHVVYLMAILMIWHQPVIGHATTFEPVSNRSRAPIGVDKVNQP
jgi:hypothetical protein